MRAERSSILRNPRVTTKMSKESLCEPLAQNAVYMEGCPCDASVQSKPEEKRTGTRYKVLHSAEGCSLLKLQPLSGMDLQSDVSIKGGCMNFRKKTVRHRFAEHL